MASNEYTCFGFLFGNYPTIVAEEYFDFRYKSWPMLELTSDLKFGVLPTGMLLRKRSGKLFVVKGKKLLPLCDYLDSIK